MTEDETETKDDKQNREGELKGVCFIWQIKSAVELFLSNVYVSVQVVLIFATAEMDMCSINSGKRNYDLFTTCDYYYPRSNITRPLLIELLKREDELRKSPETMQQYSNCTELDELLAVT